MEELIQKILENPELVSPILSGMVDKYKPILYAVCKEFLGIMEDYANSDQLFNLQAKIKRKIFDAYVEAGFSEEQAISFILNDNLQLVQNLNKISTKQKEQLNS